MPKFKNLVGQRFGMLTVIERSEDYILPNGKPRTMWKCLCDCGQVKDISGICLVQGHNVSCGCYGKKVRRKKADNIVGQKFGKLTVIERAENKTLPCGQTKPRWLCKCECGNTCVATGDALKHGKVKSCGCYKSKVISNLKSIDISGNVYGNLTAIRRIGVKKNPGGSVSAIWECICKCGNITNVSLSHLQSGHTRSCGCINESYGALEVEQILKNNNVPYKKEYTFPDLRYSPKTRLRFDFALLSSDGELHALIEYQGSQHYIDVPFGRLQREITDDIKKAYCAANNIKLYEIRYDEDVASRCRAILKEVYDCSLNANTVPSSERSEKV